MFSKNILLIICLVSLMAYGNNGPQWGPTGHRVIGEIADAHLSKKARKKITELLRGHGLAFVSTYGDDIKSDKRYDKYDSWHYVNYPFDKSYRESVKNPNGDIIMGIDTCIKKLKSKETSIEDQEFYLKFLIHLMGDLHQPLHVALADDKGGNDFQVRWFSDGSNLHRVWDSNMIDSYKMSYTEIADNISDGKKDMPVTIQGSVAEWAEESHKISKQLYQHVKVGDKLGYDYSYENFSTVQNQLYLAGIRLAHVLNEIYN